MLLARRPLVGHHSNRALQNSGWGDRETSTGSKHISWVLGINVGEWCNSLYFSFVAPRQLSQQCGETKKKSGYSKKLSSDRCCLQCLPKCSLWPGDEHRLSHPGHHILWTSPQSRQPGKETQQPTSFLQKVVVLPSRPSTLALFSAVCGVLCLNLKTNGQ